MYCTQIRTIFWIIQLNCKLCKGIKSEINKTPLEMLQELKSCPELALPINGTILEKAANTADFDKRPVRWIHSKH